MMQHNGKCMGFTPYPEGKSVPVFTTPPAPAIPDDMVKDAERYRWLRKYLSTKDFPILTGRGKRDEPDERDYIDSAIDAAIAEGKK